nr:hypothetical protein BaRGS_025102 [Batillaria attramentaria]
MDPKDRASKSCEDIAEALPTDLAMAALVESARILSKDHVCCVCVNVAATSICLNCGDMLCQSYHRECPKVVKLETKVDEALAILGDLVTMLSEGEKALERAINQLDQHLLTIDKTTRATMADIDAACDRLESSVRTCRRRLKELAKAADADMKAEVHGGKAVLLERRGKLTSHRRLTKRVQQTTPPSSVGEMTSTLQARVTGLDYSPTLPADVKRMTIRKLTIDPQAMTQIKKELDTLGQMKVTPVSLDFRFHTNHGKNIVLSDDQRSAERVTGYIDGIVLSSDPMMVNTLYEVQIVQKEKSSLYVFLIGVTNEDPATLTLPEESWHWKSAFVILSAYVLAYGRGVKTSIGQALCDLHEGCRVGVLVDDAGCLHLYKGGQDLGVAVSNVTHPCYAFFDVRREYKKWLNHV